jgi:hypothetical protein
MNVTTYQRIPYLAIYHSNVRTYADRRYWVSAQTGTHVWMAVIFVNWAEWYAWNTFSGLWEGPACPRRSLKSG